MIRHDVSHCAICGEEFRFHREAACRKLRESKVKTAYFIATICQENAAAAVVFSVEFSPPTLKSFLSFAMFNEEALDCETAKKDLLDRLSRDTRTKWMVDNFLAREAISPETPPVASKPDLSSLISIVASQDMPKHSLEKLLRGLIINAK